MGGCIAAYENELGFFMEVSTYGRCFEWVLRYMRGGKVLRARKGGGPVGLEMERIRSGALLGCLLCVSDGLWSGKSCVCYVWSMNRTPALMPYLPAYRPGPQLLDHTFIAYRLYNMNL